MSSPSIWSRLFTVSPHHGLAERRQARLLAGFAFGEALLLVFSAVLTGATAPAPASHVVPAVLAPGGVLMFGAYLLGRTRRIRLALHSCLVITLVIPPLILVLLHKSPGYNPFESIVWEVPAILIAGTLGTSRTTIAVMAMCIAFVALAGVLGPHAWTPALFGGGIFVVTSGLLTMVLAMHRDRIEVDRSTELRARVEERTSELRAANLEIAEAYEALQKNQQAMVLTEKMASLGRFTAGIAHEMSSPLAAATASVDSARELCGEYASSIDDPRVGADDHREIARELDEALSLTHAACDRLTTFVRSVRAQTRGVGIRRHTRFDMVAAVNDALSLLGHAAVKNRCRLNFQRRVDRAELDGDPGSIAQVVTNLVSNAIDASGDSGGEVDIDLERDGAGYRLRVRDRGVGIADEHMGRIFDPLFTTKPVGKGTGLGLTIVHDIVCGELGGRIEAANCDGGGAVFTVHVPTREAA